MSDSRASSASVSGSPGCASDFRFSTARLRQPRASALSPSIECAIPKRWRLSAKPHAYRQRSSYDRSSTHSAGSTTFAVPCREVDLGQLGAEGRLPSLRQQRSQIDRGAVYFDVLDNRASHAGAPRRSPPFTRASESAQSVTFPVRPAVPGTLLVSGASGL